MKKIYLLILCSLFITISLSAQEKLKGNKDVITQEREISNFTSLIIKDDFKVFITESATNKISIETDENLQDVVKTRVSDNILEIFLAQPIARKKKLNIYLSLTDSIQYIEVFDKVKIIAENDIHAKDIKLIAHDKADITMNLIANNVVLHTQDKSDIESVIDASENLSVTSEQSSAIKTRLTCEVFTAIVSDTSSLKPVGSCKEIILTTNDRGSFKGKDMLTDYASIISLDKSNIYINVAQEVIINSEQSSDVYLYGDSKISIEKFTDKSTLHKE